MKDSLEAAFSKGRQMAQGCAYFTQIKLKHSFGELLEDKNQLNNLIQSWQTWSYQATRNRYKGIFETSGIFNLE